MFDDRYDLTRAVLWEHKTQTRRLEAGVRNLKEVPQTEVRTHLKAGQEVAVAMRYRAILNNKFLFISPDELSRWYTKLSERLGMEPTKHLGWGNKQSVLPEFMPVRIHIDRVRFEMLQDITDEDCLKEGICNRFASDGKVYGFVDRVGDRIYTMDSPREAFAALINREGGRGTWESNPVVVAYDFHLVNERVKF